ncbi:jg4187 [Pararge aegeria aegeria]|uniref:Jg4187 protein n=1 Tax=Pararge aegeria aegeria TaxID=348720 RepID=A0A8S4S6W6_9NEOP|nr:jg4187 [Pararge aegeria aegeria]
MQKRNKAGVSVEVRRSIGAIHSRPPQAPQKRIVRGHLSRDAFIARLQSTPPALRRTNFSLKAALSFEGCLLETLTHQISSVCFNFELISFESF